MSDAESAKKLKDRTNALAKRIATELNGRPGVIDEINSELYTISDSLLFIIFMKTLKEAQEGFDNASGYNSPDKKLRTNY